MPKNQLRCFVAITLKPSVQNRLTQEVGFMQLAGASVNWVRNKGFHLTLKFLGDIKAEEILEIEKAIALSVAEVGPFRLKLRRVFALPENKKTPRAVVVGVDEPGGMLELLVDMLQTHLGDVGFRPDRKRFIPHVTLGRVRGSKNLDELVDRIDRAQHRSFGEFDQTTIDLMVSDKGTDGPLYTSIKTFNL